MTLVLAAGPHHYLDAMRHVSAQQLAAPNFLRILRNAVFGFLLSCS